MIIQKYLIRCLSLLFIYASVSNAAMNAYLKLEGELQGDIYGESEQAGHEDEIEVISFNHDVIVPRDPNSGSPTARRHHEPIKITKRIDKSTPLLMKALHDSEKLIVFRLTFMRIGDLAVPENYYTITLEDARIVGVRQKKLNTLNTDNAWSDDMETVWFTYDSIDWTYNDGVSDIISQANWGFEQSYVLRISDLNYDGAVNLLDVAILAKEWLAE